jgi:hypothetical protein
MSGYSVGSIETDPKKFALAIQSLYNGRSNASGTVTLRAGQTTTTVSPSDANNPGAVNVAPQSGVFLFPRSANAAAALATTFVSAVGKQTFTITHASNAQTDRTFFYVAFG